MPVRYLTAGTVLEAESESEGQIIVDGPNCRVRIGRNAKITADIILQGDVSNANIEIGDGCVLAGVIRLVRGEGGLVRIGAGTSFNHVAVTQHEAGSVIIGADCMFSTEIHMDTSDMHPIYDRATGDRINPPQGIRIGDHVWIAKRVLILKGADIGDGAVVGAGSMVAGRLPAHALALGSPAKVVRENVVWARDMDETPKIAPCSGAAKPAKPRWFPR